MASSQRKLKILCLHGYRQSDLAFRERTGALRKMLKSMAEFAFVKAPHEIPGSDESDGTEKQYGWWFSESKRYDCDVETSEDFGFDESVAFVRRVLQEQGPFDGVLAFSQGASFLGVLCRLKMQSPDDWPFNFAILVAGFRSLQSAHEQYYITDNKISLPSLHVIGETDAVISCGRSDELASMFVDPAIIRHPGGHFIAAASAQKDGYKTFLKQFL